LNSFNAGKSVGGHVENLKLRRFSTESHFHSN